MVKETETKKEASQTQVGILTDSDDWYEEVIRVAVLDEHEFVLKDIASTEDDGWQVTVLEIDGERYEQNNGCDTEIFTVPDWISRDRLLEMIDEHQLNTEHLGWDQLNEMQEKQKVRHARQINANEWVILQNHYESETDPGFCNTYYLERSEEGERSEHGWSDACQVKDLESRYNEELVKLFDANN